ncbi:uncharacterized protein BBA_04509 [Beauveria bassiana ARSEF 2860]|uniref:Uncharacterized protein n=1 Tax=Beauveria bassiana (strain ARSEF 2860) TaxID=655819 RepID=J4KNZ6_BEAB2|nr:uncharacterized protein BBA_04509 [Beauveria bassiana ARSEF 2860]EJP66569.1 hypothetical protein BBA_04509 [Beauveria bassiana ARSEF 2860]
MASEATPIGCKAERSAGAKKQRTLRIGKTNNGCLSQDPKPPPSSNTLPWTRTGGSVETHEDTDGEVVLVTVSS